MALIALLAVAAGFAVIAAGLSWCLYVGVLDNK